MNLNTIVAVLEVKAILTVKEAEALVEHLTNVPQSTDYRDALNDVKTKVLQKPE